MVRSKISEKIIIQFKKIELKKQREEKCIQDMENEKKLNQIRIIELENERFEKLMSNSEKWNKANLLRDYILAVETKANENNQIDSDTNKWIQWAKNKADSLDPLIDDKLFE